MARTSKPKHDVYRNLHTGTWSVLDRHAGKVTDHPTESLVKDVHLVVQPSGNAKVRKTKKKHVHAYVRGECRPTSDLQMMTSLGLDRGVKIEYNPYKNTTFVVSDTAAPITAADWVYLASDKSVWAFNPR
jgi:hypothetical protein